jgi:hypothetical protein
MKKRRNENEKMILPWHQISHPEHVSTVKTGDPVYKLRVKKKRQDGCACLRVSWLWLPPPNSGELQSHHVPRGLSFRLLAHDSFRAATCLMAPTLATRPRGSSGTTTYPLAPAPASWLSVATELPRVPWAGSAGHELLK